MSFLSKEKQRAKQGETENASFIFLTFNLLRISMSYLCCAFSFQFLKVSNWSVTFLSLAHVLFISASISSTWPPPPLPSPHVSSSCFLYKPPNFASTPDQTRQTNIMLPRKEETATKELYKLLSDVSFFYTISSSACWSLKKWFHILEPEKQIG